MLSCMQLDNAKQLANRKRRSVNPADLIGAGEVSRRLGIDRSTLTRRIQRNEVEPVAQLDGKTYAFDGSQFPEPEVKP